MHQEINGPDISKVYACVFRPVKSPMRTLYAHGEVNEKNVHRGAHALTGFMFAPSVKMF